MKKWLDYVVTHATNYNRNDYFDFTTLYLGTIHCGTNSYLLPHWLPRNEEVDKGGEGERGHKIVLSLQAPLLYLQISLEAYSL